MRASNVMVVVGLLVAGGLQPVAAQGLNDVGRVLQDQLLGGRPNPDRDRDAYERGRQDQSDANRREDDARRRRFEEQQRRPGDFDRQRAEREREDRQREDRQRAFEEDQRNRQYRR